MALLSLILVARAFPQEGSPAAARQLPNLMPAPEYVLQHASEIGLSAGQRLEIEGTLCKLGVAAQESAARVRQESNALAQLLAREKLDEALVASQFERVLTAESEVKRVRLKMSLGARAVLTADQMRMLESLQNRASPRRTGSPEQAELAAKMTRIRDLIEKAKREGRDLGNVREMWKRVSVATQEGRIRDACNILDEAAKGLESPIPSPAPR